VSLSYSVFGLSIQANRPIPGLDAGEPQAAPDVQILLGVCPDEKSRTTTSTARLAYVSSITTDMGEPVLRMWKLADGGLLHGAYYDGTKFWMDRAGTKLWVTWPENSSVESTALYLLGPVLAIVLRQRGVVCLHASAVVVHDRAIIFAGPEEAGKSTTAAAFARRGFPILSDDVVPLAERDGTFFAFPGSPQLRLWPESVEMLFGPNDSLPRLLPDWEKRRLAAGDHRSRFWSRPCEVASIYVLGERCADETAPRSESMSQQAALMALVANGYASNFVDTKMLGDELMLLGRLVSNVPVRRLRAHEDGNRLAELCELVCRDFQRARRPKTASPRTMGQENDPTWRAE
jgi:hypothetical protein